MGGTGAVPGDSGLVPWLRALSSSWGQWRLAEGGHGPRPGAGDKGNILHRGTEGRFWQRGMLSRGFCCLGIGYWHSATFVFFPSTNIHYIWLGWTRGAHLHVRNSIEGLE